MADPYLLLLSLVMVIHGSFCQESVPLIAWSNQKFLAAIPRSPAGTLVDSQYVMPTLIEDIIRNSQLVILFNFDKLSVDDISKYGSVYVQDSAGGSLSNFKDAYEKSASHMPLMMVEPGTSEEIEAKIADPAIGYHDQWESQLTGGHVNLLQVPLELSSDRDSSLRKADETMKEVLDVTSGLGLKYTAIFTAERPNKVPSDKHVETDFIVGRHLLADPGVDYSQVVRFDQNNCEALLYVSRIEYTTKSGSNDTVPSTRNWDVTKSNCSDAKSIELVMSIETFTLSFKIDKSKSNYYWNFADSYVLFKDGTNITYHIDATDTPSNYSYHCGTTTLSDKDSKPAKVDLINFQIQPFGVKNNTFARANDCVGFFTEAIWMGLVTTLILLLILYFGVSMLASLTVMDQFDDPKGKTITVNVVD